ncbi:4a-hydroxytetrahydrobiopterin dehydratase [Oscillochloris sp. ZM17-4]|uniref:4a-hydroxytetrahydrobiopterin dehydratase n=1 Tax=Oscillochloris sp. ZM17-4 TaxID=2866714 RepID=UPI001C73D08D|nr:4a-hydroxytetrahydrobiopterin dehydratase [Oscillochloris sp. ZM17-4]MBX0330055.1 4a-hydroxytetrahydrobiopterin dehydratase [Oscillochloris sp. ZM17-4]
MSKLSDDEVETRLEDLVGWARQGDLIVKTYKMPSFPAALAFVINVGFLAEAAGHHPDIDIRYNKVTLSLTTHDAGGLSAKDFDLAVAADDLMV